ncbi:MAG: hypothetical protein R2865_17565 [Deinococcales bacterium]
MAEHLLDLGAYDDLKTASADFFPAIVNNNTVDEAPRRYALLHRCPGPALLPL